MKQGSEGKTAILSSVLRAAHQVIDQEPKILKDPIVVGSTLIYARESEA